MALSLGDLSVLAYANGFTLWHYKAGKPLHAITEPGFFDSGAEMLATGDMVMVSAADGGRVACVTVDRGSVSLVPLG
jgi:hypothetical protein